MWYGSPSIGALGGGWFGLGGKGDQPSPEFWWRGRRDAVLGYPPW